MLEVFVLMLAGETIWRLALLIANLQRLQPRLLTQLAGGGRGLKRVVYYQNSLGQWQVFGLLYQRFLFAGLLLSGFFFWYDDLLSQLGLPVSVYGLLYLLSLELGGALLNFPLYLYRQLLIEERFGFNNESLGSVIKDKILSAAVSFVLVGPLVWLLLQVMTVSPLWWLYGYLGMIIFQTLLFWLYPLVIAPIFNRFQPLEEGSLKEYLQKLLKTANFPYRGLFLMDGSRRSAHSNAYFTGLGGSRRIVLYDTLVEQLNKEELAAVLAHEIGHYRLHHIILRLGVMLIGLLFLFAAGAWALEQQWLFLALGFSNAKPHLLILMAAWLLPLQQYLIQPFNLWMSRSHEYQADRFAADLIGRPEPLMNALKKLAQHNYTHPSPHRIYVAFHYSHPPLSQRLAALSTLQKRGDSPSKVE